MRYVAAQAEAWRAMLSEEEAARYEAFPRAERQRAFLLGRAAARTLLGDLLGVAAPAVPLRTAADGGVDVEADAPLFLSIAHSGREALAAAAPYPLGADLEQVTPLREGIERFMLHPSERDLPSRWPMDRDRALTLVWVIKEAVLKAARTGLRRMPTRLRLDAVDLGARVVEVGQEDAPCWTVRFAEEKEYCSAVAYRAGPR